MEELKTNELKNEETILTSQPAEAEKENKAIEGETVSLGKFKDVSSLLNAYNSLQAEFTKRCQRIKELEAGELKKDKQTENSAPDLDEVGKTQIGNGKSITEEDKRKIIEGYLKSVAESKQKAIVMAEGGASVITPAKKPKTISEAGKLAEKLLKKEVNT